MKQSEYVEPVEASRRVFNMLDFKREGKIKLESLKIAFQSLKLHPTLKELKAMIAQISDNPVYQISFEQVSYEAMRVLKKPCEINVLSQFKKYAIHKIHRNVITRDCVVKVLQSEYCSQIQKQTALFMAHDLDNDGIITFRDLYESMLKKIPQEWVDWIHKSLLEGASPDYLAQILIANGIESQRACDIIEEIMEEGGIAKKGASYVDHSKNYVYVMKS